MMTRTVSAILLSGLLAACAIEGVGFDGRVDAYRNAAADAREFAALNRGTRNAGWYQGWCAAIEPHFRRMSEQHARVERYCAAMQAQPDNAEPIRQELANDLASSGTNALDRRDQVLRGLSISAQVQQAQAASRASSAKPYVHCTSTQFGNQVDTNCN